jgi:catechol 2,3-dioxygenase-like lactoylglutathione lyase family enzyme
MSALFRKLHHICVVVHDLERAEAYYSRLGFGPFYDYPKKGPYAEFEVPNPAASAAMKYRCADLDNVQLQLCMPGELDSPQRRFLLEHGESVYHLGFEVPDIDAGVQAGLEAGLGIIARGKRVDGGGFCYFDTRAHAGTVLEIRTT